MTTDTGDTVRLLLPGVYTITFDLDGFQRLQASGECRGHTELRLNVTMSLAGVTVSVMSWADVQPWQRPRRSHNFKQDLMATLPSTARLSGARDGTSVHPTGPRGAYTIKARSRTKTSTDERAVITRTSRPCRDAVLEDAIQNHRVERRDIAESAFLPAWWSPP